MSMVKVLEVHSGETTPSVPRRCARDWIIHLCRRTHRRRRPGRLRRRRPHSPSSPTSSPASTSMRDTSSSAPASA